MNSPEIRVPNEAYSQTILEGAINRKFEECIDHVTVTMGSEAFYEYLHFDKLSLQREIFEDGTRGATRINYIRRVFSNNSSVQEIVELRKRKLTYLVGFSKLEGSTVGALREGLIWARILRAQPGLLLPDELNEEWAELVKEEQEG